MENEIAIVEKPISIYARLVRAQGEFETVGFDRENPHFKSRYATLRAIMEMLRPVLAKHGLCVVQHIEQADVSHIVVLTSLLSIDGQHIENELCAVAKDKTAQSVGSAITYLRRYGVMALLGIVCADLESDDDGEEAQPAQPTPPAQKKSAPVVPSKAVVTTADPERQKLIASIHATLSALGSAERSRECFRVAGVSWGELSTIDVKKLETVAQNVFAKAKEMAK